MEARSRIPVGILSLLLAASCGSRELTKDGGTIDGASDVPITAGAAGRPGPDATGSPAGVGGQAAGGVAGGGVAGGGAGAGGAPGGRGGTGRGGTGIVGTGGLVGTGGFGGFGGFGGIGGGAGAVAGRGGTGGTTGVGGAGGFAGFGGVGGVGGVTGRGGSGGAGGRGGFFDTAGTGGPGIAGVSGGGTGGSAGSSGSGGGGTSGVGGTGGGSAGTGGTNVMGSAGRGGAGGSVCLTCRTTTLSIAANDLVYNPVRNELYVSVSGDAAMYPNTIAVVDPSTSSVISSIPIGSNPRTLALSDDGSTLWVGMDGSHSFRKVTLTAKPPVVGPLVHLPKAPPTNFYDANAMAVLPGAPASLAVSMVNGYAGDLRVYDDGVARPIGAANVASSEVTTALTVGPPGFLFGVGNIGGLYVFKYGATGITQATSFYGVARSASTSLVYNAGKVYAQTGEIIDVSNPSAPFWTGNLPYQGPVALRDAMSLLMLTTTSNTTFPFGLRTDIRIYSTGAPTQIASVPIPASALPGSLYPQKLVYAGGDAAAFLVSDYSSYTVNMRVVIVHDPALGTPTGGTGGTGGSGGAGGAAGGGGTGGAPDPCPLCTFTTVPAYGMHMAVDQGRKLIYLAAHAQAVSHPSSIVTIDSTAGTVSSIVPVGNDPEPIALSDDGSALWVGLAGEHRLRRMTPGTTPVPGPAYVLPTLLTTGEQSIPYSIAVLPGAPASTAVGVYGSMYGGRGVFILDDGALRANYVQPPEVSALALTNGPPGYLLGIGEVYNNLVTFKLGTAGVIYESYPGMVTGYPLGTAYDSGYLYVSTGEVIDLTNPDDPLLGGRFAFAGCALAMRSPTRVMMLCPNPYSLDGPILRMLDPNTFTTAGSVTLPTAWASAGWVGFAYLGGDAVALLASDLPLQIMHAPFIASPP